MKIYSSLAIVLTIVTSQANATTSQPEGSGLINNDLKTCFAQLNELKKLDHTKSNPLNKKLMSIVQSQAALSASEQYASKETMSYINSQQNKAIRNTCAQISQKLDETMIKKAIASLS